MLQSEIEEEEKQQQQVRAHNVPHLSQHHFIQWGRGVGQLRGGRNITNKKKKKGRKVSNKAIGVGRVKDG